MTTLSNNIRRTSAPPVNRSALDNWLEAWDTFAGSLHVFGPKLTVLQLLCHDIVQIHQQRAASTKFPRKAVLTRYFNQAEALKVEAFYVAQQKKYPAVVKATIHEMAQVQAAFTAFFALHGTPLMQLPLSFRQQLLKLIQTRTNLNFSITRLRVQPQENGPVIDMAIATGQVGYFKAEHLREFKLGTFSKRFNPVDITMLIPA